MAVLGSPEGEVVSCCVTDGVQVWSYLLEGTFRAIGASDNSLYVGTYEGSLCALPVTAHCGTK
jgi:hypothetical protein